MLGIYQIKKLLNEVTKENNLDEPDLIKLAQCAATQSSKISSPSGESALTSMSPSSVVILSPTLRWLLPPAYNRSSVIWSSCNNTCFDRTQARPSPPVAAPLPPCVLLSIQTEQKDIQSIAHTLFRDVEKDIYNDMEFFNFLNGWFNETKEYCHDNQIIGPPPAKKFKRA